MKLPALIIFSFLYNCVFPQISFRADKESLSKNKIAEIKEYGSQNFDSESLFRHIYLNDSGLVHKDIYCHYFVNKFDTTSVTIYEYDSLNRETSRIVLAEGKRYVTKHFYIDENTIRIIDYFEDEEETLVKRVISKNKTVDKFYKNGKKILNITAKKRGEDSRVTIWRNRKFVTKRTTDYFDSNNRIVKTVNKTKRARPRTNKKSTCVYSYSSKGLRTKECRTSKNTETCTFYEYIK